MVTERDFKTSSTGDVNESRLKHTLFPVLCAHAWQLYPLVRVLAGWLTGLSLSFVAGHCNYFGFRFFLSTYIWKLLYLLLCDCFGLGSSTLVFFWEWLIFREIISYSLRQWSYKSRFPISYFINYNLEYLCSVIYKELTALTTSVSCIYDWHLSINHSFRNLTSMSYKYLFY